MNLMSVFIQNRSDSIKSWSYTVKGKGEVVPGGVEV